MIWRGLSLTIHVTLQHLQALTAETEHHVDVGGRKQFQGFAEALVNLCARTELVVAVRELENRVVKTLHPDTHAVHIAFKPPESGRGNLRRVCFTGNFFDSREKRAGVLNCFDELVFNDCCRAAADIHALKVVAQGFHVVHLFAQIHKVFTGLGFLEKEAVEGAVGAQRLTERNVRVEQILVSLLRSRRPVQNDRVTVEIAVNVVLHDAFSTVDHPVRHQFADGAVSALCHGSELKKATVSGPEKCRVCGYSPDITEKTRVPL